MAWRRPVASGERIAIGHAYLAQCAQKGRCRAFHFIIQVGNVRGFAAMDKEFLENIGKAHSPGQKPAHFHTGKAFGQYLVFMRDFSNTFLKQGNLVERAGFVNRSRRHIGLPQDNHFRKGKYPGQRGSLFVVSEQFAQMTPGAPVRDNDGCRAAIMACIFFHPGLEIRQKCPLPREYDKRMLFHGLTRPAALAGFHLWDHGPCRLRPDGSIFHPDK